MGLGVQFWKVLQRSWESLIAVRCLRVEVYLSHHSQHHPPRHWAGVPSRGSLVFLPFPTPLPPLAGLEKGRKEGVTFLGCLGSSHIKWLEMTCYVRKVQARQLTVSGEGKPQTGPDPTPALTHGLGTERRRGHSGRVRPAPGAGFGPGTPAGCSSHRGSRCVWGKHEGPWCLVLGVAGTADKASSLLGDCAAGHWCKGGATSKAPTNGPRGLHCPAGHYCLEGT